MQPACDSAHPRSGPSFRVQRHRPPPTPRRLLGQGGTLRELLHEAAGPLPPALVRGLARELLMVRARARARPCVAERAGRVCIMF